MNVLRIIKKSVSEKFIIPKLGVFFCFENSDKQNAVTGKIHKKKNGKKDIQIHEVGGGIAYNKQRQNPEISHQ